ncbi:hypothetical protein GCM10011369_18730 [Neiella marina]|uniref:Ice-binding protein C-terminal domain-containing protein n=1 Tax=Neiella marina TaxID=508461 RepID=A0A8J2U516_9GAMM|nr:PEP-CTERM sorting domain-containing protein [Neiella marina]GGA77143.1 hypothetical protein GCM10011369_18730 [Neiella marina]
MTLNKNICGLVLLTFATLGFSFGASAAIIPFEYDVAKFNDEVSHSYTSDWLHDEASGLSYLIWSNINGHGGVHFSNMSAVVSIFSDYFAEYSLSVNTDGLSFMYNVHGEFHDSSPAWPPQTNGDGHTFIEESGYAQEMSDWLEGYTSLHVWGAADTVQFDIDLAGDRVLTTLKPLRESGGYVEAILFTTDAITPPLGSCTENCMDIPEPATYATMALGLFGIAALRRKKTKA